MNQNCKTTESQKISGQEFRHPKINILSETKMNEQMTNVMIRKYENVV